MLRKNKYIFIIILACFRYKISTSHKSSQLLEFQAIVTWKFYNIQEFLSSSKKPITEDINQHEKEVRLF